MIEVDFAERWFRDSLKPDPILTVSEWADKYRMLSSKAASEPGPWRTKRTPYLKEIMDCLSVSHPAKKIVFKKASQIGGTECGNNWLGYIVDYAPGPVMLVQPTVDLAKRNSHLRIEPLIEESPTLRLKISSKRSKDTTNTILQKDFDGGTLVMTGANSAPGLRSMPAKYTMLDEIDAYPRDVDGEGDPVSLVRARSRTFSRRKEFLLSTPTLDGASKIDEEWELSDKRRYYVPCPHCAAFQHLKFENLKWDAGKPLTASYYCEECGIQVEEKYKTQMLLAGEWRAENTESTTVGFHLNSLYSPLGWYSWAELAKDYDEAAKQQEKEKKSELMRTFVNTVLGETYKEPGEAPEWQRIYLRREKYEMGKIPEGVLFLTCGADVQKDRIECEVVGWGLKKVSWSIQYTVFNGDTAQEQVWNDFKTFIGNTFTTQDGKGELPIKLTCVDSGFNTQHVYNFCRQFPINKVIAVKGLDSLSMIVGLPKIVDFKKGKLVVRRAIRVFTVGVSLLKSEFYGWLKIDPPIGETEVGQGFCHFPEYDEEYFKQLTAEKVVARRNRKGFAITEWVKDRERNEALDCRIYARAAASIVGLDRMKENRLQKFRVAPIVNSGELADNKKQTVETKREVKAPRRQRESFWE